MPTDQNHRLVEQSPRSRKKMMTQNDNQQSPPTIQVNLHVTTATPATQALDNNFRNSVKGLRKELVRTIYYLHIIYTRNVYRFLGFTNIADYAHTAGGLSQKQCKAFLKIGSRMAELPQMAEALEKDLISWRKAAAIADIAVPENITSLIDTASQLPMTELKKVLPRPAHPATPKCTPKEIPKAKLKPQHTAKPKNTPPVTSNVNSAEKPCFVTFKLTAEQYSRWSAAMAKLPHLSKEEALIEAIGFLTNEKSPDRAENPPYLLVIHQCPACRQATLVNNRGTFAAPKSLLEAAQCDAIIEDSEARRKRSIPPRLRRAVLQGANHACQSPNCSHTHHLEIHHRVPVAQGGQTNLENLIVLCRRCHRTLHQREDEMRRAAKDPVK